MKGLVSLLLAGMLIFAFSLPVQAQKSIKLTSKMDKVSYSIGLDIGKKLKAQGINLNPRAMYEGLRAGVGQVKPQMTEKEMMNVMMAFRQEIQKKNQAKMQKAGFENLKKGQAFLESNKKKKGVKTTKSGLQYKVLKSGKGKKAGPHSSVTTHYKGTLLDGTVFDSSYQRGKPATFQVGQVIRGWTEALQMMQVGDKWMLYIPSELAYGQRGAGAKIGPNSTLIFEIELLDVK